MKELWEKLLKYIRKLTPAIKRAFLLPPGVILVLFPATMVLCIIALNNRGLFPAMEYTIYLISAYSLAVLIVGMSDVSKLVMRRFHGSRVWRWAQNNPVASLFISDFRFRGELSLYQGLLMSTLFAVFKGAAAIFYQSQWFAAVAGYYIIFGISRLLLVRSWRKSQKLSGERRRIREERLPAVRLPDVPAECRDSGDGGSAYPGGAHHRVSRLHHLHNRGLHLLYTYALHREHCEVPAAEQPGAVRFQGAEPRRSAHVAVHAPECADFQVWQRRQQFPHDNEQYRRRGGLPDCAVDGCVYADAFQPGIEETNRNVISAFPGISATTVANSRF